MRDDVLAAAAAAQQRATVAEARAQVGKDEHMSARGDAGVQSAWGQQADARSPEERLRDRLRDGHWTFCRQDGGHPVYKRTVVMEGTTETCEQTFSMPATRSDWRGCLNTLSDLRARDNGVMSAMPLAAGSQNAAFAQLSNLHQERKEAEARLQRVNEDICMIESEWGYG